jgi:hypothetical protein
LLLTQGKIVQALDVARRAFTANETPETKSVVGLCLCSPLVHPGVGDLRDLLVRAISEPWAEPSLLAPACGRFLALNTPIRDGIARAAKAWPSLLTCEQLLEPHDLAKLAEDRLLLALLESAPLCEVGLERFVTNLRFNLLAAARVAADGAIAEPVLRLYCAIARQCFINDYVFAESEGEIEGVRAVRDTLIATLASKADAPALSLVAAAAYVPLHTLPGAESLLD